MPEMHLRELGFTYSAYGQFTKSKERMQNFKKQDIHNISIKTNQIKLAFNMTWLMENLKICLEKNSF